METAGYARAEPATRNAAGSGIDRKECLGRLFSGFRFGFWIGCSWYHLIDPLEVRRRKPLDHLQRLQDALEWPLLRRRAVNQGQQLQIGILIFLKLLDLAVIFFGVKAVEKAYLINDSGPVFPSSGYSAPLHAKSTMETGEALPAKARREG